MNKKKQKRNQKRQARRGLEKRKRRKKVLYLKHTMKVKKKPVLQKVTDMSKVSLRVRIRFYFYKVIRKIKRLGCFIGRHDWKLCSGKEGNSMFTCIRCWKSSKKKWGEGGSEKYYDKKMREQMEVAMSKNWEKKEDGYYFKGQYVKLSKEEVRRLEIMLGNKKLSAKEIEKLRKEKPKDYKEKMK